MKIILLRHGEPAIDTGLKVSPCEYAGWLKAFNLASIKDIAPPVEVKDMAHQCAFVVCSDLVRSVDSARALGIDHIDVIDPLFREFEIPFPYWSAPKLSAATWTVIFRLVWLAGYSNNAESSKAARQRAVMCMTSLENYAKHHGTVLFIGHGSLLWYLSRLLSKNGWQGPTSSPRKHWEYCQYKFDSEWYGLGRCKKRFNPIVALHFT